MKAVIVNGFRRGGTNLFWNILCSLNNASSLTLFRNNNDEKVEMGEYFSQKNEEDFKEFIKDKKLLICKGVNDDIKYNSIIKKYCTNVLELGLVRDRAANCEGWVRRGYNIKEFIKEYNLFIDSLKANNNKLVSFKSVIETPFKILKKICYLIDEPVVEKIIIRSKNVYTSEFNYGPAFDNLNDYKSIKLEDLDNGYIFKRVDEYQIKNLDKSYRNYLELNCKDPFIELNQSQFLI